MTSAVDGRPTLVMPLMERSLSQRMAAQGPCRSSSRWDIRATARRSAGPSTRELGILHRDIKPDNVLLSSSDEAFLGDFGITTPPRHATSTASALVLSAPHAPPERFSTHGPATQQGDVYSLSSTLYAALSGGPPFGTGAEGGPFRLNRVASCPVPPLVSVADAVNVVLATGLAKDPEKRYPTPGALSQAFADAAEGRATDSEGTTTTIDTPTSMQRFRLVAAIGMAIATLAVSAAFIAGNDSPGGVMLVTSTTAAESAKPPPAELSTTFPEVPLIWNWCDCDPDMDGEPAESAPRSLRGFRS